LTDGYLSKTLRVEKIVSRIVSGLLEIVSLLCASSLSY
jgi:hypothetical protein